MKSSPGLQASGYKYVPTSGGKVRGECTSIIISIILLGVIDIIKVRYFIIITHYRGCHCDGVDRPQTTAQNQRLLF